MRGRINSDLYSGIAINAITDQFEVSGGNIMAGDFVQYKYAEAEQKVLYSTYKIDEDLVLFELSESLFVDKNGNLYEFENDDMTLIDSLSFVPTFFDKISSTMFCCLNGYNNPGYIISVNHQNKSLSISATIPSVIHSPTTTIPTLLCYIGDNKVINGYYQTVNSSSDRALKFVYKVFDISDLQNITEYDSGEYQITIYGSNYSSTLRYAGHFNNKIGIFSRLYSSSYSSNNLFTIDYDIVNKSFTKNNFSLNQVIANDIKRFENNINQIFYASSVAYSINLENGTITSFAITSSSTWGDADPIRISEIDEDGEFYVSSQYHWVGTGTVYYDEVTIAKCKFLSNGSFTVLIPEVKKIDVIPSNYRYKLSLCPVNCGNKALITYKYYNDADGQGTYYYNAEVVNGELIIGEQTDMVEPYDGINPKMLLGVAATGGQIGDTIDVYVPLANT